MNKVIKQPVTHDPLLAQNENRSGTTSTQAIPRQTDSDFHLYNHNLIITSQFSHQIINDIREGIIVYGCDLRYLVWNPYMEQLSGIPASEVLGRHPLEVFPFLREAGVIDILEKALGGETSEPIEFQYRVPQNGRTGWTSDETTPLRNSNNEIVGVIGTVRDITERRLLENTQQFLSQYGWTSAGEDFFQALARYLGECLEMDYVCIDKLSTDRLAAQTVAIYFDGAFEDNVEYTLKDTPCGNVVDNAICCFPQGVRNLFPQDAVLQQMIAESYAGTTLWSSDGEPIGLIAVIGRKQLGNPKLAETILKLVAVRAAGEMERRQAEEALKEAHATLELRVMERTKELSDAIDKLKHEISERKRLESQLFEAKKLESIGQLAGGVAHEVRNPLNAILTITEALFREKEIETNPEYEPYIQHIRTQVTRLANLMNDLLDLGKAIPPSSLQPVLLCKLCRDTIDLWKASGLAINRQVELSCDLGAKKIRVRADALKLQQIIFNLLENAGYYTPPEGMIRLQVDDCMEDVSSGNMAVIRIIDQGAGIPDDLLAGVFEPFYSNRKGGTGLGLTLVKHFIENMGGSVGIRNNDPPPGCTAEITIPCLRKRSK